MVVRVHVMMLVQVAPGHAQILVPVLAQVVVPVHVLAVVLVVVAAVDVAEVAQDAKEHVPVDVLVAVLDVAGTAVRVVAMYYVLITTTKLKMEV